MDKRAVEEFLGMGYMMGEQTWFDNVFLMPAATVLTYDFKKHTVRKKRYWWWDELNPIRVRDKRFKYKFDHLNLLDFQVKYHV